MFDPSTGEVTAVVAHACANEVRAAVADAVKAQPAWAALSHQRRARVLLKFLELANGQLEDLTLLLAREHGKTLADARGDIQRGLEVVEFAAGIPHLLKGEFTEGAGPAIDMYSIRQPLGVAVGITPFNFPAMIPLWMAAPAIGCGNAFVLKPSERTPSVPLRLAELFLEAGLPPGVFNVVNGGRETVEALIADEGVDAVSFVGSSDVAQHVYSMAAARGKRVQCFGGAKNHMIIAPDADLDYAADSLIGAAYGSAGERCMAISVAVPVGEATAQALIERLIPRVIALKVGPATDPAADFGPLITMHHKERVLSYVEQGIAEGATLLVDRRNIYAGSNGFFMGPSMFDHVKPRMRIYQDEIFGPVLSIVRSPSMEDALDLASRHRYGNGVAIYTRDGGQARNFASRIRVGMVGINVPIPVPLAYYTFGGWKQSGFGDLNQHGPDAVRFYTHTKTITSRWKEDSRGAVFTMAPMH